MYKRVILFFCFMSIVSLYATHNRAGEITYVHISGLTFQFTITTYTYTPSPADRPEIDVFWGDGTFSTIERQSKTSVGNDISKNVYVGNHTYPSLGSYAITFEDPNRNAGVVNIPNSVEVPFFIKTVLVINPFLGGNSSPTLLNPPIDNGCTQVPFYHNPGAIDPDGDSLSYELIACMGYEGITIPGYTIPYASHSIDIDPVTGDLVWDSPMMVGEYNIAILISEWRNGIKIGSITRDMQISIVACNNQPPEIHTIEDTCILAGTPLLFDVIVTDPNSSLVTLSATGDPFLVTESPAQLLNTNGNPPDTAQFLWYSRCSHVKKNAYSISFKATDNGPIVSLNTFKTLHIKIIAPKPEDPIAIPIGNQVSISWDRELCSNAIGYDIYKRKNSFSFTPDHCETGLPEYAGYTFIGSTNSVEDTTFIDDGSILPLLHGNLYCYRIVAIFPDGAESYVSDETCTFLWNDAPLITHVDVDATASDTGIIFIRWSPPREIDSIAFPGPIFEYHLYRKSSQNSEFQLIGSTNQWNDTSFTDHELNTEIENYTYKVELWGETALGLQKIETSDAASSLFLTITPTDRALDLHWLEKVPWDNHQYVIYRYNESSELFDSIDVTENLFYTDFHLQNGKSYSYYIKSIGGYFVPDTLFPLYNRSQVVSAIPIDNIPPQLPETEINTDCKEVVLTWKYDSDSLAHDVFTYYIYYRPNYNTDFYIIDSLDNHQWLCYPDPCEYSINNMESITGCYALSCSDSIGNMSQQTPEQCFDTEDCTIYSLPNIFTPNNDGINDIFGPFPYTNVQKIDMHIYDRWGKLVFKTDNPDINWDGTEWHTGGILGNGTYYYSCDVYIYSLSGLIKKPLHGTIILSR